MAITDIIWLIVIIVGMILACYFTSGISNMAGTIFERKSNPEERATVHGGKKQTT